MIDSSTEHHLERRQPRNIETDKQIMIEQNGRINSIRLINMI